MLTPERLPQQSLRHVGPVEAFKPPMRTSGTESEAPDGASFSVRSPLSALAMAGAEIRELVEHVGVRLQPTGRDVAFCQEGQAEVDDVVGEDTPVRILRRLRRIE